VMKSEERARCNSEDASAVIDLMGGRGVVDGGALRHTSISAYPIHDASVVALPPEGMSR
jgi:hypothetical protein